MINKYIKINQHHNHNINMEIDYFIAGVEMKANAAASTKTIQIMYNE